ncbi:uncharacterized protein LOC105782576 isoform X3 [Gossypium raimondii]|uniref:Uncharacterized protein isoform X3 n=1 Tax=Gossypium hirsutum TaxID=3635 RepID=A0ABM3BG92_GOSHI|nr:uncharacterized protein LOC121225723 isoform X3 [Gossypium hirsutum]XP_052482583.1 uncharacterized protein LOC105782576 isoform X3 [Gossypium raimondii]
MARSGDPQGDGGEPVLPRASSSTRLRSRPDPFLVVCRCFSVITSLTAILCIAVNVLSAVRSFKNGADVFDGIFRCYAVVIAFFVVLAETEWGFIIKFWKVLEYWAGRGMLQILKAKGSGSSSEHSKLYAPCLWCSLRFLGNLMHWLSQTFSPAKGNYKGTSSSRSGGIGEKKRRT